MNDAQGEQKPLLQASSLSYRYKGRKKASLHNVSLIIDSQEICGVIGPNGAGKTTLISLLTTLLKPQEGQLTICGHDALRQEARVRPMIGLVPQDLALYERLTAWENIVFFGRCYGLAGEEVKGRGEYLLEQFGLVDYRNRQVNSYSGGMKRRLNLLLGLLHRPRLLFLDEPTVGIDAQSRNLILERLAEMSGDDLSMIYTSHYFEEVQRLCRRVIVIDHGEVVACGLVSDLVAEAGDLGAFFLRQTGRRLRD